MLTPAWTIRRATVEDLSSIVKLQQIAYQREAELYNDNKIPPLTETEEAILEKWPDLQLFVAETHDLATGEKAIIGSIRGSARDGFCLVGRLCVHPAWERQGLGKSLIHTVEHEFAADVHTYELFTGGASEGNIRLYERLGYRIIYERFIHERLTLLTMHKPNHA